MMKMKRTIPAIVCLVVLTCLSCNRDHLYYETVTRHKVQLDIDWSQTAFVTDSRDYDENNRLNGVTIFAYDAATHRLAAELPPDANWQSPLVYLDPGIYDLVVINDSRAELPAIGFSTDQPLDGFCAYADARDGVVTEHPDYLTVSTVKGVTILPQQADYHYDRPDKYYTDLVEQQISTVQRAVTKKVNIRVYVKGMNYCKGMQPAFITGLSKSVNLSTRKPGKETTIYAFNLINREFRNSDYTEAILTQSFYSFGFDGENLKEGTKFELTLNFVMVDNTIHTVKTDVTPQFEEWLKEHSIELDLDLDIDVAFEVELPPASPPSAEESNQGMAPETVPWNDIIQNIVL